MGQKLITKTFIEQNCATNLADLNISTWCDGVPDGEAVQIGGRSAASPNYWNHQSSNPCVAASWNEVDYTEIEGKANLLRTGSPTVAPTPAPTLNFTFAPTPTPTATPIVCVDDDAGIKNNTVMENCSTVAGFCADTTNGPTVQKYCPKTCGNCTETETAPEGTMIDPRG